MSFIVQVDPNTPGNNSPMPAYSGQPLPHQPTIPSVQQAITQALEAQSAVFEAKLQSRDALLERLMGKLDSLAVSPPPPPTSSTKPTLKQNVTPRKAVNFKSSTSVRKPARAASEPPPSFSKPASVKNAAIDTRSPEKGKAAASPKRRPHQAITTDYPKEFAKTKVSLLRFGMWLVSGVARTDSRA